MKNGGDGEGMRLLSGGVYHSLLFTLHYLRAEAGLLGRVRQWFHHPLFP